MSVFDPTSLIISGADAAIDAIIDALKDELPLKIYGATTTSISTSSGTAVSALLQSRAVEADEAILFLSQMSLSTGTSGDVINVTHFINTSTMNNWNYFEGKTSSTDGKRMTATNVSFAENLSGTIDFDVKWNLDSGAGTIYSNRVSSWVLIFKKR